MPKERLSRTLFTLGLTVILTAMDGCSHAPNPITDGRVTVSVPHDWKASKASDGSILIETNFIHPLLSDDYLPTDTISIRSRAVCLSDKDMDEAKADATRSMFSHRSPTASWFEVETGSASLSCLLNEKAKIEDLPNDLMFCMSRDGVSLVFNGRSSMRPKAVEILKSIRTTVSCTNPTK